MYSFRQPQTYTAVVDFNFCTSDSCDNSNQMVLLRQNFTHTVQPTFLLGKLSILITRIKTGFRCRRRSGKTKILLSSKMDVPPTIFVPNLLMLSVTSFQFQISPAFNPISTGLFSALRIWPGYSIVITIGAIVLQLRTF